VSAAASNKRKTIDRFTRAVDARCHRRTLLLLRSRHHRMPRHLIS
jgi:hypothetical protein